MDKKILKVFLVLFFIFALLQVLNDFNVKLPLNFNRLNPSYLSIVYILAFCFAYQNGDEGTAKVGIFLVILNLILRILSLMLPISFILKYSKLVLLISRISSVAASISSLLYFVVLFNLINSDDGKVNLFKMITILLSVILIFMNILGYIFFKLSVNQIFSYIHMFISRIIYFSEYSVFFFYLIIKDNSIYVSSSVNNSIQQNVSLVGNTNNISSTVNLENSNVQKVTPVVVQPVNIGVTNDTGSSINSIPGTDSVVNSNVQNVQSSNVQVLDNSTVNNKLPQDTGSSLEDFMNLPSQNNNNN